MHVEASFTTTLTISGVMHFSILISGTFLIILLMVFQERGKQMDKWLKAMECVCVCVWE